MQKLALKPVESQITSEPVKTSGYKAKAKPVWTQAYDLFT